MPPTRSSIVSKPPPVTSNLSGLTLACPTCHTAFQSDNENFLCPPCGFELSLVDGIWRALPPAREKVYRNFIPDYETIRRAEARGCANPEYYLSLPFRDVSGKLNWEWKIRGASYRYLETHVWPQLEKCYPQGLRLLDVGAGNCWLSYRVALRGHEPTAVDLLLNEDDGLAAARHYSAALKRPFPRFQAEMDHLPFASAQFDVVVFNASLHYSVDYFVTLSESLRVLHSQGQLLIIDSPIYHREESGQEMLKERHRQFEKQYGFRSDTIPSLEYLTFHRLQSLAHQLHLEWRTLRPWYGLQWALRPLKAKLQGKREPSKFHILWGERVSS